MDGKAKTAPEGEVQERFGTLICPKCGQECDSTDNFCGNCATRLRGWCYCWIKGNQKFDCGKEECPGIEYLVDQAIAMSREAEKLKH